MLSVPAGSSAQRRWGRWSTARRQPRPSRRRWKRRRRRRLRRRTEKLLLLYAALGGSIHLASQVSSSRLYYKAYTRSVRNRQPICVCFEYNRLGIVNLGPHSARASLPLSWGSRSLSGMGGLHWGGERPFAVTRVRRS